MENKSPLKTNEERLMFVILQNKVKTTEHSLLKIGDRYFKVRELG